MKQFRDTYYLISESGEVYNTKRKVYLKTNKAQRGYRAVRLGKLKIFVHRIVAELYILNPNNYPYINHIDGNTSNNHVSNLEWCTQGQNVKHAYDIGLHESVKGEDHFRAKLKETDIPVIRDLYNNKGYNYAEIARMYGVTNAPIWQIINNKIWKHVK
jgi:hypothetical protein